MATHPALSKQVGYGVHQWGLGADDSVVMPLLAKPFEREDIFTCGEAYSDYQGWVEGALRSANLVLKHFDINSIAEHFQETKGVAPSEAIRSAYEEHAIERIKEYIDPEFDPKTRLGQEDAEGVVAMDAGYDVRLSYLDK